MSWDSFDTEKVKTAMEELWPRKVSPRELGLWKKAFEGQGSRRLVELLEKFAGEQPSRRRPTVKQIKDLLADERIGVVSAPQDCRWCEGSYVAQAKIYTVSEMEAAELEIPRSMLRQTLVGGVLAVLPELAEQMRLVAKSVLLRCGKCNGGEPLKMTLSDHGKRLGNFLSFDPFYEEVAKRCRSDSAPMPSERIPSWEFFRRVREGKVEIPGKSAAFYAKIFQEPKRLLHGIED